MRGHAYKQRSCICNEHCLLSVCVMFVCICAGVSLCVGVCVCVCVPVHVPVCVLRNNASSR